MKQDGTCPFCKSEDVSLIQFGQSFRACKPCLILANRAVVREINFYRMADQAGFWKQLKNVRRRFGSMKLVSHSRNAS